MRATDDRYRGEQARFELAMRMIGHEARTGTIRYWTGLSDDRIRKLYAAYFKHSDRAVKRRRGRSPSQIGPLVRNPERALESGVVAHALIANGLLRCDGGPQPLLERNIGLGHRFCECFETYTSLIVKPTLNIEWTWNLLVSMRRGDEIGLARCERCEFVYIVDLLALPRPRCPACEVLIRLRNGEARH